MRDDTNNISAEAEIIDVLSCHRLHKSFIDIDGGEVKVLNNVDLHLVRGESVAVVGASGSGKTTLLQLAGGLDTPSMGEVWIDGQNLAQVDDQTLSKIRNQKLGFVYQFHHLMPEFSALDNVQIPLWIASVEKKESRLRAEQALEKVGLADRMKHKPTQLSGGERQRVAIARAVIAHPLCILADEPTGNLDRTNAEKVIALLMELKELYNMSILVNTHDLTIAKKMNRIVSLDRGSLTPMTFEQNDS